MLAGACVASMAATRISPLPSAAVDATEGSKSGKIVAPFGLEVMNGKPQEQIPGFYLVLRYARRRAKIVAAFCKWVEGEQWLHDARANRPTGSARGALHRKRCGPCLGTPDEASIEAAVEATDGALLRTLRRRVRGNNF